MKSKMKTALLSVGLLLGSASMVHAADGTVTFIGSVHSGACSIKPDSVDQTVHLGAIAKHQLQSGGKSEARRVLIELEGCDLTGLTDNTVTTTFTGAPSGAENAPFAAGTIAHPNCSARSLSSCTGISFGWVFWMACPVSFTSSCKLSGSVF